MRTAHRARHPYRRGLFRRGPPRRAARRDGRRGVAARSRGRGAELPRRRAGGRGGEGGGRGRGASRLRIPGRESRVRRSLRRRRPRLRRPAGRRGPGHGVEGRGEARDGGPRACPSSPATTGKTRTPRRCSRAPARSASRCWSRRWRAAAARVAARRCRGRIQGGARRRTARGPVELRRRPGADRALHRAPRHVEVQVFADAHGNAVHLFERDCSLQRRHQKVVEEAPAPGMSEAMRAAMGAAAVAAAKAIGYRGAGTVEFIADASQGLREDRFWFMEMNTRLQGRAPGHRDGHRHGPRGMATPGRGRRAAAGAGQAELSITGHAVEARVYAEDPERGFLPATGAIAHLAFPPVSGDLRIDHGVREGDAVTAHYDPMLAKVIAHGPDRAAALDRLAGALRAVEIAGVTTNVPFLSQLVADPEFRAGDVDTGLIERALDTLTARGPVPEPGAPPPPRCMRRVCPGYVRRRDTRRECPRRARRRNTRGGRLRQVRGRDTRGGCLRWIRWRGARRGRSRPARRRSVDGAQGLSGCGAKRVSACASASTARSSRGR